MSLADRGAAAANEGWSFFDRGLIDAAAALQFLTGEPVVETLGRPHRFHKRVFLAPPWIEIFSTDRARRHGFDEAVAEYVRLLTAFSSLGHDAVMLPKWNVEDRAGFVLGTLSRP